MRKILKYFLVGFGVASLVGILVVGWTVYRFFDNLVSRDEVARVASPSGAVEAVLVETNGGATTSFGYEVYLVEPDAVFDEGESVAFLYAAVRSDSAYGANLRWEAPDRLSIDYLTARSAELHQTSIDISGVHIVVELRSGIEDPTAPAGGMHMNHQVGQGVDQQ